MCFDKVAYDILYLMHICLQYCNAVFIEMEVTLVLLIT